MPNRYDLFGKAYGILSAATVLWPIPFLRPVLDIPYCHHEKWDAAATRVD